MQVGPVSGYGYSFYPSNVDYGKTSTENENIDKTGNEKKNEEKADDQSSSEECETCKNRSYQDGSNESNVSFKSATRVSPNAASAAVRSHEGEHVANAYSKAEQNNGKVVSATVSIHTNVCPECGRTYVSGGPTNTQIRYYNESNPYQQNKKSADSTDYRGANMDFIM